MKLKLFTFYYYKTKLIIQTGYQTIQSVEGQVKELSSTKILFEKITKFVFYGIFLALCIYFLYLNLAEYLDFGVTTDISTETVESLIFPSITFCDVENHMNLTIFKECRFDGNPCDIGNDFEVNRIWLSDLNKFSEVNCLKFNGGIKKAPYRSKNVGFSSGLYIAFEYIGTIIFYVGENSYLPNEKEITHLFLERGTSLNRIKKNVDKKL